MYRLKQGELLVVSGRVMQRPSGSADELQPTDLTNMQIVLSLNYGYEIVRKLDVIVENEMFSSLPLTTKQLVGNYSIELAIISGDTVVVAEQTIDLAIARSPLGYEVSVPHLSNISSNERKLIDGSSNYIDYVVELVVVGDRANINTLPSDYPISTLLIGNVLKGAPGDISEDQLQQIVKEVTSNVLSEGVATIDYVNTEIDKSIGDIEVVLGTI